MKKSGPGRRALDGAIDVVRVNISITKQQHQQLKKLAGTGGVSVWIRNAIEKASNGNQA